MFLNLVFYEISKLRNKLTNHFGLVVRMFAQNYCSINTFPFDDVIKDWQDRKRRYLMNP
jgi:hypothetical protein